MIYDPNSSSRLKKLKKKKKKKNKNKFKWITFLQTPFPLGFNIYHECHLSKMSNFDVFFFIFWDVLSKYTMWFKSNAYFHLFVIDGQTD